MKKIFSLLSIVVLFAACSKSNSNPPPDNTVPPETLDSASGLPIAYYRYYPSHHAVRVRRYGYDSNKNLVYIYIQENDTTGNQYDYVDSGSYYFTINSSTNLPTGYHEEYYKDYSMNTSSEDHVLYFNDQKQLIKDSLSKAINSQASMDTYAYIDQTIVRTSYYFYQNAFNVAYTDSMYLVNGNMSRKVSYDYNPGYPLLYNDWTLNYSTYANPFYIHAISSGMGGLLITEGIEDFISPKMAIYDSDTKESMTFVTDSKGRIISGTAPDGGFLKIIYAN